MINLSIYGILVGAAFRKKKKKNAAEIAVGREQETASPLKVTPNTLYYSFPESLA